MLFLLDMSQLIHEYWHVAKKEKDIEYDVSERTLYRMDKLRAHFLTLGCDCTFVAVFDNPSRVLYRKLLIPSHKADRTKDEGLAEAEAATMAAVQNDQDWHAVVAPSMFEADDVMASMAKQYGGKVLVHSQDRDCHSMLEKGRVSIIKKSNTPEAGGPLDIHYFTADDLAEKYDGLTPQRWIEFQILIGGKDNVVGWHKVGETTALRIIASEQPLGDIDLEDETIKLNKAQKEWYGTFKQTLPKLTLVRTLYNNLDWPVNVPMEVVV